ncbi:Protein ZINC INDUCED FACILITATOR 1-like [Oopsacas minuta]|uniref:Protein ZINC INDUCED FACILITATOR 1-like n=1 Tax=Oopsacas minuta TaxID=111878 RepID=A0AAV7KM55_9METZ|nr:Protein ZINC INDUCED FACILITATOR 1-like [Oopsacas minuta]
METENTNAKKATPLPILKVLIISSILFANVFGLMLIFPILPFITHDFFPNLGKSELGYKQGYLGTAFQVGKLCGVLVWGRLSDIYGRRPTMLCGLLGSITCILLFGFSQSFEWACTSRFLWGLLNGNYAIATTYLSEILDDTNQAGGFIFIGIASALGRLAAPVIGGFLSQPASKYPWLDIPLFRRFPYLLPCLFGVAVATFSFIGAYKYLNETLERSKRHEDTDQAWLNIPNDKDLYRYQSIRSRMHRELCLILKEILQRNTLLAILIYSAVAFITMMSQEIVPLLMVTDYVHGGYCMDGNEIGLLFVSGASFFLFNHIFLLSKVIKWLNYRRTIRLYFLVYILAVIMLPFVTEITGPIPSSTAYLVNDTSKECHFSIESGKEALNVNSIKRIPLLFWFLLFLIMSLLISARNSLLTSTVVLLGNSSEPRFRATINSLGQFAAAISRLAAPAIGAILFAWSEGNNLGYPFNYHLTFLVLGLVIIAVFFLSFGWTKQVEIKKNHNLIQPANKKPLV